MVTIIDRDTIKDSIDICLFDGSRVLIRPIISEDKGKLLLFHGRLSQDTRFLRYHYFKGDLTESELRNFCEVDYYDEMALVAEREGEGLREIIGVGRYSRLPNFRSAEVAFVVQDSEQRKGLGTQLLKHLAVQAYQRDISIFVAEVLRENGNMLNIFRKSDPKMAQTNEGSGCTVNLSVVEAMLHSPD